MPGSDPILERLAGKLDARATLEPEDIDAILAIPYLNTQVPRSRILVRQGDCADRCHVVLTGFTYRQKLTRNGARQIVGIDVSGDFACLSLLFLPRSDHDIVALTDTELAEFDLGILQRLALTRPAIGRAMWMEALVATSIVREWTLNAARRDARARISHYLCELALRLDAIKSDGAERRYVLPMTQEEIGDTVGLTPIHVNRVFRSLDADRLIERSRREIIIRDFGALARIGDFDGHYLFLGEAARSAPVVERAAASSWVEPPDTFS